MMPLANAYPVPGTEGSERRYPLHARVCDSCLLVQVESVVSPQELFGDYAYFSSYSDSWLEHCRLFAEEASRRFDLTEKSLVVEVASNDGYLLQYFMRKGIRALGVEPAANVAAVARERGIPTEVAFFSAEVAEQLAESGKQADLLVANNVVAHVPELNDFIAGLSMLLRPKGVLSIEVPHILRLIEGLQFDTIYHEHFSYFSLLALGRALRRHGLRIFDVQRVATHGGSLRVFACHQAAARESLTSVDQVLADEVAHGLDRSDAYRGFSQRAASCREGFLTFVRDVQLQGNTLVAYGAAAKGNTFLNYCGVNARDIAFAVDRSPHKQGRLLPGTHIQVRSPAAVDIARPEFLLILPWNLRAEITTQMAHIRHWGGRFVTAIPSLTIDP